MANHLTPDELAEETGLTVADIVRFCCETGVPIYHGRIDKWLFRTVMKSEGAQLTADFGHCRVQFLEGDTACVEETEAGRAERDQLTLRQHMEWATTHVVNHYLRPAAEVDSGFAAA